MAKILKNAQFYSEKWPRKTATKKKKTWLFLLYFRFLLSQFLCLFPLVSPLISCCFMLSWNPKTAHRVRLQAKIIGEIQTGAHKRGLKPQIFKENRGEILSRKSGLFGANWDLFRAYRGLFGADWDQFLRTPQPRGKSRNSPKRALFGPIGAFRAKPPFVKPPFGFPRNNLPMGRTQVMQ